ncbi:MAG: hypothetical protein RI885_667, partial [Actinomycetota bacterium]
GIGLLGAVGGARADGFAQSGVPASMISMALIGLGMGLVYLAVLLLVRNPEASGTVESVRARLRRG